jgi:hypothetical protein
MKFSVIVLIDSFATFVVKRLQNFPSVVIRVLKSPTLQLLAIVEQMLNLLCSQIFKSELHIPGMHVINQLEMDI